LFGLFFFLAANIRVYIKSLRTIAATAHRNAHDQNMLICLGLTASGIGLCLIYLIRNGFYYDPMFWSMIGLLLGVPTFLSSTARDTNASSK
jgi:hypothetical protein